ncbi:MAG TPA: alkaline phosphatase family protein [Polyangia bacterium]|nr:alkaline phosphatase family protein [Polyangia bacterium]
MRRFRPRIGGWSLSLIAITGVVAFGVLHRRVRAMPPPAQSMLAADEAPHEAMDAPPPHARVGHVLIISEDGLRADAVGRLHLHWHELLRQHGASSLHARTIRDASTLPAHASMLSGVEPKVHGLTWNTWRPSQGYIKSPTIFTSAQEHGLSTAFFTGKTKLRHIVPPGTVGIYERPGYYCKKVAEEAASYLTTEKPALAFVHFSDPDEAGHSKGWMSERQLKAISDSDRCLGIIYEALDKAHLLDDTLIIVSADHGGHNRVHSGATLIDREIPWIACGPGVREDYTITEDISTKDTAATALYALGLPISREITGKPRLEIFSR